MAENQVADLVPTAERALAWMRDHGDADGDGFLECVSHRSGGNANQGWKDSADGVQFADGNLATAPLALSEVQGYAYEAAMRGADLLDAFDRPGSDAWREWADTLGMRFRQRFWLEDSDGPYVAVALDADKKPVDAVASNMGHLPGTGILDAEECAHVAHRLTSQDMRSTYGLRTMSTRAAGFNPLGYHSGSVWPHDTAITAASLTRAGHASEGRGPAVGPRAGGAVLRYRLPELFGEEGGGDGLEPVPHPQACAPQAWAAAAAVVMLQCALGLEPSVPVGEVRVAPPVSSPP